jgi:hypothetical protein
LGNQIFRTWLGMPRQLSLQLALFISTLSLALTAGSADEASPPTSNGNAGQTTPPPSAAGGDSPKQGLTKSPKPLPTKKDKAAAIDRGPQGWDGTKPLSAEQKKKWDAMTPEQQAEARRKWLLKSGDF